MKTILLLFLGFMSPWLFSKEVYVVNSKLFIGDKLIGSPTISTCLNEKASITVEDLYTLEVTPSKNNQGLVNVSAQISFSDSQSTYQPSISTPLNEEASVEIDDFKWTLIVANKNQ